MFCSSFLENDPSIYSYQTPATAVTNATKSKKKREERNIQDKVSLLWGTNTTLIRSQNTNTVSLKNRRSLQCKITLIETVKQSRYGLQGDEKEEHKNCISDKTQG